MSFTSALSTIPTVPRPGVQTFSSTRFVRMTKKESLILDPAVVNWSYYVDELNS